jgi:tight adherence protein C
MLNTLFSVINNPKFLIQLVVVLALIATAITIVAPMLGGDVLQKRMKAVALERERLRGQAREQFNARAGGNRLRQAPKPFMKRIVDDFNLTGWLATDTSKLLLARAGFRGPQAEIGFLFFRLISPPILMGVTAFYVFVMKVVDVTPMEGGAIVLASCLLGLKAPEIFLANQIGKRQDSIRRAFPDALDLLLICVESGLAIEAAMQRVGQEIGSQSVALAEEFTLTMAELSYLSDRVQAYTNMGTRIGLDSVSQIVLVFVQAERVGTPLASALRVVSQEAREKKTLDAEKKAASLPPKLTLPMMLFFLPCIFVIILGPAAINTMAQMN